MELKYALYAEQIRRNSNVKFQGRWNWEITRKQISPGACLVFHAMNVEDRSSMKLFLGNIQWITKRNFVSAAVIEFLTENVRHLAAKNMCLKRFLKKLGRN